MSKEARALLKFQSTLPREERPVAGAGQDADNNFNPRSHERSDITIAQRFANQSYFNPRSHERSDEKVRIISKDEYEISIHAPTRGATEDRKEIAMPLQFQSTLPREERL